MEVLEHGVELKRSIRGLPMTRGITRAHSSSDACLQEVACKLRSTEASRSESRGNFYTICSVRRDKQSPGYMLLDTGVTTSIRLWWGRWIPGCTSYTAAQWDCCWGIDLVDPAEPPLLASLHSSVLDATWRRAKCGRGEEDGSGLNAE